MNGFEPEPINFARVSNSEGARYRVENKHAHNQNPSPLLLTLDEAAQSLGVSRRTVTSLTTIQRRTGRAHIGTVRIGRSVRVPATELAAYVSRLKAEAGLR